MIYVKMANFIDAVKPLVKPLVNKVYKNEIDKNKEVLMSADEFKKGGKDIYGVPVTITPDGKEPVFIEPELEPPIDVKPIIIEEPIIKEIISK